MTGEEIKAAIDRLQVLTDTDIVTALTGEYGWTDKRAREHLIDLLRQADPDTHMELPKDADGEYIHIGDRMEDNERVARIVLTDDSCEPSVYLEKLPSVLHEYFCHEVHHYHKPTVEDVLREFGDEVRMCCDTEDTIAEYAAKLREMMQDD